MEKVNRRYKKESVLKSKKKKIFIISLVLIFAITLIVLKQTGAIFQTTTESDVNLDIAFYCIKEDYQTMTLRLDDMIPRTAPYVYNFTISNNNGTKRTETQLEYDLTIRTTTNLPITFKLFDTNGTPVVLGMESITEDDDGTYFRHIITPQREFGFVNNETNKYRIQIEFPEIYNSEEYQDIIELVEINVDSKQKV